MLSVSVVVPFHNREQFLEECLGSIVRQTCSVSEIIVVDDGSSQPSKDFLHRFRSQIRIVELPRRQGPAAARNAGIAAAQGDCVAFLDDDDTWEPGKIQMQTAYLESHPECHGVHTAVTSFFKDGSERLFDKKAPTLTIKRALRPPSEVTLSSFLVRTWAIRSVGGFDPGIGACEDLDLGIRLVEAGYRIDFLPVPLTRVRRTGHAHMTNRTLMLLGRRLKVIWKHRKIYDRVRGMGAARWQMADSMYHIGLAGGGLFGKGVASVGLLLGFTCSLDVRKPDEL